MGIEKERYFNIFSIMSLCVIMFDISKIKDLDRQALLAEPACLERELSFCMVLIPV